MSKKKNKAAKGPKLPKHVAGVKLPKDVRRTGEALIAQGRTLAASPAGKAAIAKGLTLAAGLASAAAERSRRAAAPGPGESAEGAAPSPVPPLDPRKVAEAVSTVADAVLGRIFGAKKV